MSYQPIVKHVDASDNNQEVGLKQLVVTMHDGTQIRVFNSNGKKTVTRLLTIPCPICRKDFYCKCFDRFVDILDEQIPEENWK